MESVHNSQSQKARDSPSIESLGQILKRVWTQEWEVISQRWRLPVTRNKTWKRSRGKDQTVLKQFSCISEQSSREHSVARAKVGMPTFHVGIPLLGFRFLLPTIAHTGSSVIAWVLNAYHSHGRVRWNSGSWLHPRPVALTVAGIWGQWRGQKISVSLSLTPPSFSLLLFQKINK